jgi:beta-lactamase regulating signal transducer with metallopeptidase domain
MTGWSGSQFSQALGWATLNSFWQMALIWCVFVGADYVFQLTATRKYRVCVAAMFFGFIWFIATFISFYQSSATGFSLFDNTVAYSNSILQISLFSASITYLLLLVFPATRLYKNWQFVQLVKKEGVQKADLEHRLFVQKISAHLNISKKVKLVVSALVTSPITIGYLKPVILLPVAVLNRLSTKQVEAILLHELSHIRRYDYLINLIVSIIHTFLYFNPFAKAFMSNIEAERETCCDEMVLQFGYNKVDYASALLHLQKASSNHSALALGAAGKQNLLNRIEKIVGMEKKKTFKLVQVVPLLTAIFCVLLFNSILIIKDAKGGLTNVSYAYEQTFLPWQLDVRKGKAIPASAEKLEPRALVNTIAGAPSQIKIDIYNSPAAVTEEATPREELVSPSLPEHIVPVSFDEVNGSLTKEEHENVENAVAATKKVVSALHWKEIDASLAEVLNKHEKEIVKNEYQQQVEQINWDNIKQNVKASYEKFDWNTINENVSQAMAQVQLDSLQTICSSALTELQRMEKELNVKSKTKCSALPDVSVEELKAAKVLLQNQLDSIKSIRHKKVVRL